MKRFLTIALTLMFTTVAFAATSGAASLPMQSGEVATIGNNVTANGNTCCWIYLFGMWMCIPCG
jgi:hypothetical protein